MSTLIVGETSTGRFKIARCKFYLIVAPPQSPLPQTAHRKLLDTVCGFEERTGRTWPELVADGFRVMKVFSDLVDCTEHGMPEYLRRRREQTASDERRVAASPAQSAEEKLFSGRSA